MKKMFKTYNDLAKEYDKGVLSIGNIHVCPVCNNNFKTEKAATKHIEERSCYSLCDLFKNTVHEITAYSLYKEMIDGLGLKKRQPTVMSFRKSNSYNAIMRFVLFCNIHTIRETQREVYIEWLHEYLKCNQINKLMAEGVKESNLNKFYIFVQRFGLIADSEVFYNRHKRELMEDGQFFIRSLEKAKIGLKFLLEQPDFDFDKRMESLEIDYQVRFTDLANEVLGGM